MTAQPDSGDAFVHREMLEELEEAVVEHAVEMLSLVVAQHEDEEHNGEPCPDRRIAMLGFVAVKLGFPTGMDEEAADLGRALNDAMRVWEDDADKRGAVAPETHH